eukprot:243775_1
MLSAPYQHVDHLPTSMLLDNQRQLGTNTTPTYHQRAKSAKLTKATTGFKACIVYHAVGDFVKSSKNLEFDDDDYFDGYAQGGYYLCSKSKENCVNSGTKMPANAELIDSSANIVCFDSYWVDLNKTCDLAILQDVFPNYASWIKSDNVENDGYANKERTLLKDGSKIMTRVDYYVMNRDPMKLQMAPESSYSLVPGKAGPAPTGTSDAILVMCHGGSWLVRWVTDQNGKKYRDDKIVASKCPVAYLKLFKMELASDPKCAVVDGEFVAVSPTECKVKCIGGTNVLTND